MAKGLNAYHGTHALRERGKKWETERILTIRFEMPYNIWYVLNLLNFHNL